MGKYTLKKRGGAHASGNLKGSPLKLSGIPNISPSFIKMIQKFSLTINKTIGESDTYKLLLATHPNNTTVHVINYCLNNIYNIGNKYTFEVNRLSSKVSTPRSSPNKGSPTPSNVSIPSSQVGSLEENVVNYFQIDPIHKQDDPNLNINTLENKNQDDTFTNIKIINFISVTPFIEFNDELIRNHINLIEYISYIYKFNIIQYKNYDELISLYCSFCVINSLRIAPKQLGAPFANPKINDSQKIAPFIQTFLNTKTELMINMIHAFNVLTEEVHNDLIYIFSPYNIFNKYLNEVGPLKNNIGIMKICILLYSIHYTPLQNQILDINLKEKNTFSKPLKLDPIMDEKAASLIEGDTILDKDLDESGKMDPIQNYIQFLYSIGLPSEPLITKYHDFLNKEQYLELAKTINEMYGLGILTF
jgi:hypothetical protein